MCDIWKGNANRKMLTEEDIGGLLNSLKKFGTRQVLLSGGEALLHPNLFRLCTLLKKEVKRISLLTTGVTLKQHAAEVVDHIDDITISLDGDQRMHDRVRNLPGAFRKLEEGMQSIRDLEPRFRITARAVIHRHNYKMWPQIIETAKRLGVDQISFFPADVSSTAFNREQPWDQQRQLEILPNMEDLPALAETIEIIIDNYANDFTSYFIAESPSRLRQIHQYYAAHHGLDNFPYKKCNAPWVSTVIEADGSVKPCFFHPVIGNIRNNSLSEVLNSEAAATFRQQLDMNSNDTCKQCVCYLHLPPSKKVTL
jgi:MoaA/NifB/PqqE/SkfB family radical SAM enzyme